MTAALATRADFATLARLDEASRALARCADLGELKKIRDTASALHAYSKAQKLSAECQAYAARIVVKAEARLGQIAREKTPDSGRAGPGRGRKARGGAPRVFSPDETKRFRAFARLDEAGKLDGLLAELGPDASRAGVLRLAGGKDGEARSACFSSASVEWYTPARYIEAARDVLGAIDLDPASCEAAQRTVKAGRFYTRKDDGLSKPWPGRVWLNPPYGNNDNGTAVWSVKLIGEYDAGHVSAAILLVPATIERLWFAALWRFPICFPSGRVNFWGPRTNGSEQAPSHPAHASAFVYFGPDIARFRRRFGEFGHVVFPACPSCGATWAKPANGAPPRAKRKALPGVADIPSPIPESAS